MSDNDLKKLLICEYDNRNQSKLMHKYIDETTYRFNRQIIHGLYDNMNKYTFRQIQFKLKYNTKQLD